jgi:uncharacterized protein
MTTNASPYFDKAQEKFLNASDDEERLMFLEEMIREAPKHKSSENLLANLRTRKKKLEEKIKKSKKSGKSSKVGIRKDEMQAVIVGKTNSGKSSLLKILTNASPKISMNKFTTTKPQIGMMSYATTSIQLVEIPATDSEYYDKGIVYTADTVLIIANSLEDLNEIINLLKTIGKKIIVINKTDLLSENEKRKLRANLNSKYRNYEFVLTSTKTKENIEELKDKLFQSFKKLRVYTKEPGKEADKKRPMILEPGETVKDCAEKILKGFSQRVKQVRIWGPSSKFPGQIVGMKHKVKDLDIVEFKTK